MVKNEFEAKNIKTILRIKAAIEASEGIMFERLQIQRKGDELISSEKHREQICSSPNAIRLSTHSL